MDEVLDTFPSLSTLYLYLTDRCNLRCSHCWIAPAHSENRQAGIPFKPLKKAIKAARSIGLCGVKLTGGEPLLYKEIKALLAFLSDEELTITIETNGTLFDESIIKAFQEAKVSLVSVSLDAASETLHDEIRGQKGCYRQTRKGLALLGGSDINSQAIMTLQQKNRNEIQRVIRLCEEMGIDSLKINHLIPCGRGTAAFERGDNLSLEELIEAHRQVKEEWDPPKNVAVYFDLPLAFQSVDELTSQGINECKILNIMGILGNGDFSICGIGHLVEALRMGNIETDDIVEVWKSSKVFKDLRGSLPQELKGACGNCIFKFQCLGNCRANAYAVSKDLYAPYFLCQQLQDKKKFPESRCIHLPAKP